MGRSQSTVAEGAEAQPLLEREGELTAIGAAIERAEGGEGSLVLIEASAGIGKTRLLAEAKQIAEARGLRVQSARGGEIEREMPFGIARQLFEPIIARASEDERSQLLTGSAELALIALGEAETGRDGQTSDPFAPIHGLYWLIANLCDSRPVLLAVDDAHWADAETLRFLDYLGRRLAELPALVIACFRTGEAAEPAGLERLRLEAQGIHPRPLTAPAVSDLIAVGLQLEPDPAFAGACADATAGNPFLVAELVRALRSDRLEIDQSSATVITQLGPENVARQVLVRLGRFGTDAIALSRAIAVLGGSPQLRHATALAGLAEESARELLDSLREAEILAPGLPLDFVHPLVRQAIYRDLSEEERSVTHRRAAQILGENGAAARELAPHLAAATPNGDQWVVSQLRAAAREAMAAGAPEAARRFLVRALDEPPEDEINLRYELGRAMWAAEPFAAPEVLALVAQEAEDTALRLQALADTAWTYFDAANLAQTVDWLALLLEELPGSQHDERLAVEASLSCVKTMNTGRSETGSRRIRDVAEGVGDEARGERLVRQALSMEKFMACDPAVDVIKLATSFPPPPWTAQGVVPGIACKVLAWSGRWDEARKATVWGWESAESTGLVHVASYRESLLAEIDRLAGMLASSEAHARTALHIVSDLAPAPLATWSAISNLLATLIARGELDEAAELAGGFDLSAPFSQVPMSPIPLEMRGTLRLAQGELNQGVEDLLALGEDLEGFGLLNPAAAPWRQEVAPALSALDRTDEAEPIIAIAEERAAAFGAPHLIGTVLRARALIEPRRRQIEILRESVAALEAYGPPHELSRSLLELGAAMRRDGRRTDAREPLARALELAHRSGAGEIEGRAREELAAIGSRPRSVFRSGVGSLTASEQRIAKLAADGLGNREIAERLFVTRRTVETHLTHVYAKLEIDGRDALPVALAENSPVAG